MGAADGAAAAMFHVKHRPEAPDWTLACFT